jgi:hypothetical protein
MFFSATLVPAPREGVDRHAKKTLKDNRKQRIFILHASA